MAFIGIGKFSKYYYYIILVYIFQFICDFFIGFNKDMDDPNKKFKNVESLFNLNFYLKDHYLIQNLLVFLSYIICSIIFYRIYRTVGNDRNDRWTARKVREEEIIFFNKRPEYIGFKIILISFLFAMGMILLSSLASLGFNASLWNIEIALMMIINSIIFNNRMGKHHYVSIFLFAGFLSLLQIIYMLSPRTKHSDCNTTKECQEKYLYDNNIIQIITIKFGGFYVVLMFLLYITSYILRDISWVKSKFLMDVKSIKTFKIILSFGIVGSLLVIIILTTSSFIPCNTLYNIIQENNTFIDIANGNNTIDFNKQICNLIRYNKEKKELNFYYDNIFIFFEEIKDKIIYKDTFKEKYSEIFSVFLYFVINIGITFSHSIMLINIDAIVLLVSNNFNNFLERFFYFILNKGKEDNLRLDIFLLLEIEEIIAICGYMIHMELLELKFCKLDYDLKENIILRSIDDSTNAIYREEEEEEEEEEQEQEDDNKKKVTEINDMPKS